MIPTQAFRDETWWYPQFTALNDGLVEAMEWQKLLLERPNMFAEQFYVGSRLWEYPWALHVAPPRGAILDVGSNAQFHVSLLGQGHTVTAHYTAQDTQHIGMMNCWGQGWHSLRRAYERYDDHATVVLGNLEALPFPDGTFETIYCLSVIEHVEPWNLEVWLTTMWRLLAPGGRLCFTVDWAVDVPVDKGTEPLWNHDLMKITAPWGAILSGTSIDRLPTHNPAIAGAPQNLTWEWPEVGQLTVYGFVLQKASSPSQEAA